MIVLVAMASREVEMSGEEPPVREEARAAVGALIRAGRIEDAVAAADRLVAELTDGYDIAGVLLSKFAALLNLNQLVQSTEVADALWARLAYPGADSAQVSEFHSLAADLAYRRGSVEQCVSHLVQGARALESTPVGRSAMRAWVTTATAYSLVGFHRQAMSALARAQDLSRFGTADDRMIVLQPEIPIRYAVLLDQQGESAKAYGILGGIVDRLRAQDITQIEQPYLGYAIARHQLLRSLPGIPAAEHGADAEMSPERVDAVRDLLHGDGGAAPESLELQRLGEAVLAAVEGKPREALRMLADAEVTHSRLGAAELPRLRTLIHVTLGEYDTAFAEQCVVTSLLAKNANRLYSLFVDGVTTRIDYDELLRNVGRYADEARTDPLTGLPNRRHLEQYVADLDSHGMLGTIVVADVDRFKEVNTVHGHLIGDQVLQRIAAVISRTLRRGDFVARFGGDEFVVVMPGGDVPNAEQFGRRLTAAVAAYNWDTVVPGTTISLTLGLSTFAPGESIFEAFRSADLRMLSAKHTAGTAGS